MTQKDHCNNTTCDNIEKLNLKLRAIRNLNQLIFRQKKKKWTPTDICQAFTSTGGYLSCWMAVLNKKGSIAELAHSGFDKFFTNTSSGFNNIGLASFVYQSLSKNDILINESPITKSEHPLIEDPDRLLGSLTAKIQYNDTIYGILSVTVQKGEEEAQEQQFLLEEAVNDLAFEFRNIEIEENQKKMMRALKESENLYRTIFETTGNATILIEEDTSISYANREFEKLSGYSRNEIEGSMSWTDFFAPEDLDRMKEYHNLRRISPEAAPRNYEAHFIDRIGNVKDVYATLNMIPETRRSVASFTDITEQKMLESEIIRISEQERQQIGNNLHDGLGPHLVGVKFMMNLLEQKLEKKGIEEVTDVREINTLISEGIDHTRRLVKGLVPVDIDADGLIVALEDLATNIQKLFGITCTFEHDESLHMKDNIAATHLYLIAREATNNAIKHSRADKIEITINEQKGLITLKVKDNGIGIEKLLDTMKGMGINIMKYRARLINATLDIRTNRSGGTSVSCIMKKSDINIQHH